jgi:hypothetical protein
MSRPSPRLAALWIVLMLGACEAAPPPAPATSSPGPAAVEAEPSEKTAAPPAKPAKTKPVPAFVRHEAKGRLIAIGDVHGDFSALKEALKHARLTDEQGKWVGGNATLVQTGDILDRGDDEQALLDYLAALKKEASAAGGQVILMNGNHEIMNIQGDLRYVTPGGFADFDDAPGVKTDAPDLKQVPAQARARLAAFRPGGPYAKLVANYPVIAVVNRTVFAHGGVLPQHVEYGIDRINHELARWMRGEGPPPSVATSQNAPFWSRHYSKDPADCALLERTLKQMDADRMVVGHTVQRSGVTSACDGKVWRIDVGMSAHYGGKPAALELTPQGAQPLTGKEGK